jgi:nucleoside-diphosphate-sugar epimerase
VSRSLPNATLLVIGGGYVGLALAARARAAGLTLRLTTRSAARAATLRAAGLGEVAQLDLTQADAAARIAALASGVRQVVCLLPPSAGIDAADSLAPWIQLCAVLSSLPDLESAVMASSTAVYGDQAGAMVNADTPCTPDTPRAQRLYDIETHWLARAGNRVVRLAGLYGPGRIVGAAGLQRGEAVSGEMDAWLNLIHRSDAAALLLRCLEPGGAAVELGCDGTPVVRRHYYQYLAAQLGLAAPSFSGLPAARGSASRRCSPALTIARTGWQPQYRDFRAGLAAGPLPLPLGKAPD